jgi:hypothetical protein
VELQNPHASETAEWERYEDYKCAAGRKGRDQRSSI